MQPRLLLMFYFGLASNGKLVPLGGPTAYHWEMNGNATYCSKNSTHEQNGASCAYFAVTDVCPDDSTKSYWECLP